MMRPNLFFCVRITSQRISSRTEAPDVESSQRGIAAIEFSLVVVLLLVIAFGLVSYGVMFWAKQDLSQLAGEGARYALAVSMTDADDTDFAAQGCTHVENLVGQEASSPLNKGGGLVCSAATASQWATINLAYPVSNLPIAGLVGELAGFFPGSASWVPSTLTASSSVQLVSSDG